MGKIEKYTVTLDKDIVKEARKKLKIGQSLSPVLNQLLKEWVEEEGDEE